MYHDQYLHLHYMKSDINFLNNLTNSFVIYVVIKNEILKKKEESISNILIIV